MSLFKSAATIGGYTLISRILGYVRDMFTASALGVGLLSDAFVFAFRLPNVFRTLSAEGAFNSAFVPLFSGKLATDGQESAISFAEQVLSFMFIILVALTIVMQIFMPEVMRVVAPGFAVNVEKFDLTVHLARVMFPYLVFISMVALFSGILNSIGRFAVGAAAPIWLNITMIFAVVYLAKFTETPAHALAWGVLMAGVIQLAWLIAATYKAGIVLRPRMPRIDAQVKTLLKRMVPGIIGGGITQINILVSSIIATSIAGAVSYLYYADRLVQFPLAIIGTALGTALLPSLSKHIKNKQLDDAIRSQNKALEIGLLLTIPAAAALLVLAGPLVSLMFERGKFTEHDTIATMSALMAYSMGLPAFVLIKIFAPGFFANGDTKTPVKIALVCFFVNVALSYSSVHYAGIGHVGVALATTISSWINTILLCAILIKRGLYKTDKAVNKRIVKIIFSASVMTVILYYMKDLLAGYLASGLADEAYAVMALIITGMVSFFAMAYLTGGHRVNYLKYLKK